MEPEKPPRRKKGATPVTIDLEPVPAAEETTTPPAVPGGPPDVAAAASGTEHPRTEAQFPDQETPDRKIPEQDTGGQEAASREPFSSADEPAPNPTPDSDPAAAPAFEEPPAEPRHEQQFEAAPHAVQPPGKSGAFAAAIVGGLVALAGAGALQYGGYLPTLGPGRAPRANWGRSARNCRR